MTGQNVLNIANKHIGDQYVLGSLAPKNDSTYDGPFDCAEFVSWVLFQVTQKLYGCVNDNSLDPAAADAGTIYWANDVHAGRVKVISIAEARNTPGAILLRVAGMGLDGHIVFSQGDGTTTEAMGAKWGVTHGKVNGRRWTFGMLIPGIDYTENTGVDYLAPSEKVYFLTSPLMSGYNVKLIQQKLVSLGKKIVVDGFYGSATSDAVREVQNTEGLTPDGEVGPATKKALGLSFN